MSKPKYPLCFDPLCEEHNPASPTDTEILDAIIANHWSISWNPLHNAFVVQREQQVVGNIARGPLRAAVIAAISNRETR